ncbi:unnamed protein product [Didymodactylos carnosus]|uniref:16S rRNA (Cytosine(1402)-N(4))-methyltransferase n=1 Tax=Didymodactylos carnosus TaxID=1234261 RepID=A0A8S2GIN3_9BILA|nr:unnamed protein product [Didymodactylos carnosus]CAF3523926.1 unnamed protein product [Didymodactylos carnosus]
MEVNQELEQLRQGLDQAIARLANGGTLAVISFHSLEDRIVKQKFKDLTSSHVPKEVPIIADQSLRFKLALRNALKPSAEEIALNTRARSAILRAIQKKELA